MDTATIEVNRQTQARTERVAGLDALRAVAILSVVMCHVLMLHFANVPRVVNIAYMFGATGVDLFFALSGYLIGGILFRQIQRNERFSASDLLPFWTRRWWRTLPNYYLFVGLYIVLYLIDLPWYPTPIPRDFWRYCCFLQNPLPVQPLYTFFPESWSLAVEEWMYLLLPVTLVVVARLRRSLSWERVILLTVVFWMALPLVTRFLTAYGIPWDIAVRRVVLYRLDGIATGMLLAYLQTFRPGSFQALCRRRVFAFGLAVVLLVNLGVWYSGIADERTVFGGAMGVWMNVLSFSLTNIGCALIVAFASHVRTMPGWLSGPVYRVSLYSYALYLCHVPVLKAVAHLIAPISERVLTATILMECLVALAIAAVIYHVFEHPMTNLRDKAKPEKLKLPRSLA